MADANSQQNGKSNDLNKLKVTAGKDVAKGVYSNLARVTFTKNEFILGFVLNIEQEAQLVSRIIVSPEHMENLSEAIQESLAEYKEKYGEE
ncbi:DUF3467 domain-containing protein [Aliifodinibius sp. S!AR15-10]|uniref:DUF3467 domain-containing protein n=1 Tax=Aliifodinibius sp. S!AR15-10 TaxID=2950437 RepID=UPI0028660908|nr:DUF3467 domain-containing protein [Aliifodinibius sp. S!AR15-10]MDR8390439.1 DUF3467 domain-containing protein [Aliifodinibius sp. S!AR15-10]